MARRTKRTDPALDLVLFLAAVDDADVEPPRAAVVGCAGEEAERGVDDAEVRRVEQQRAGELDDVVAAPEVVLVRRLRPLRRAEGDDLGPAAGGADAEPAFLYQLRLPSDAPTTKSRSPSPSRSAKAGALSSPTSMPSTGLAT